MAAGVTVERADLGRPGDADAILSCLDAYARDPMGQGAPLAADLGERLIPLLQRSAVHVWLARSADGAPLGIATVQEGVSTFAAQPRWNVHDLAVVPAARGRGIGRELLEAVQDAALAAGCSAVTLEVRDDNARAQGLYRSLGYGPGDAPMAFWTRPLEG